MRKIVLTALLTALASECSIGVSGSERRRATSQTSRPTSSAGTKRSPARPASRRAAPATFEAKIDDDNQVATRHLTYSGLSAPATVAHIHFGNRYLSGGVSVFFCGGGPAGHVKPACPDGTTALADISGRGPADIAGPAGQGIPVGNWDKFIAALRAGMTYVNVHDAIFPSGEIRGQINDKDQKAARVRRPTGCAGLRAPSSLARPAPLDSGSCWRRSHPRNHAKSAWLRGRDRLAGIEPATSRSGGARSIP